MPTCRTCKEDKKSESFQFLQHRNKLNTQCTPCKADYSRQHYKDNKQKYLDKQRKRREDYPQRMREEHHKRYRKKKDEVLRKYGGRCECCGENRNEFLAIDHIAGGGTKERKSIGSTGVVIKLYKHVGRLEGYRLLCHNCNSSYGYYGYCPHKSPNAKMKPRNTPSG